MYITKYDGAGKNEKNLTEVNMKLFIDDIRIPSDVGLIDEEWTIIRDFATFKVIVDNFVPTHYSFDHDLHDFNKDGSENTGLTCAKYLVERDSKWNMISLDTVVMVHSMNPIGKKNIEEYIKSYRKFKLKC